MILPGVPLRRRLGALVLLLALGASSAGRAMEGPCGTMQTFGRLFSAYAGLYQSGGATLPPLHLRALRHELGRVDRADLIWALRDTSLAGRTAPLIRFLTESSYLSVLAQRDNGLARGRLDRPETGAMLIEVDSLIASFDCRAEVGATPEAETPPTAGPGTVAREATWLRWLWFGAIGVAVLCLVAVAGQRVFARRRRVLLRRYGMSLASSVLGRDGPRPAELTEISRTEAVILLQDDDGLQVGQMVQVELGGDWRRARITALDGHQAHVAFRRRLAAADLNRIVTLGRPPAGPVPQAA